MAARALRTYELLRRLSHSRYYSQHRWLLARSGAAVVAGRADPTLLSVGLVLPPGDTAQTAALSHLASCDLTAEVNPLPSDLPLPAGVMRRGLYGAAGACAGEDGTTDGGTISLAPLRTGLHASRDSAHLPSRTQVRSPSLRC